MNTLFEELGKAFELKPFKAKTYSPLVLAYIGDSIYDLIIRTLIVNKGSKAVGKMHKEASSYVNAKTQAAMYHAVVPFLSEEEMDAMKRGRNANSGRTPKNADLKTYKHATGFEALIGFHYVSDNMSRIVELIEIGLRDLELGKKDNNGEKKAK